MNAEITLNKEELIDFVERIKKIPIPAFDGKVFVTLCIARFENDRVNRCLLEAIYPSAILRSKLAQPKDEEKSIQKMKEMRNEFLRRGDRECEVLAASDQGGVGRLQESSFAANALSP